MQALNRGYYIAAALAIGGFFAGDEAGSSRNRDCIPTRGGSTSSAG